MNFYAARARDRAKCAENARTEREFIADIFEAADALRLSIMNRDYMHDQVQAAAAIMAACEAQMNGRLRLRVVAESKDDGWTLRDIDAAAVPGAQWGGKSDAD